RPAKGERRLRRPTARGGTSSAADSRRGRVPADVHPERHRDRRTSRERRWSVSARRGALRRPRRRGWLARQHGRLACTARCAPRQVGPGWGHSAADTVDNVAPKSLQAPAVTAARLLLRIAAEDAWPGKHGTPEDMSETIANSAVGWYVKMFGRHPFQPKT